MTSHSATDLQTLAAWLNERRWYGDKGQTLASAETAVRVRGEAANGPVSFDLVALEYAGGQRAEYLLLRDPGDPDADALEREDVRTWLIQGFGERRVLEGARGTLRWRTLPGHGDAFEAAGTSRVFRGEQSNSSVVYGDRAIMKLFRKMREGVNPEVEIGAFLTEHTGFRAFPRLLGTIELDRDGETTTIAAVQAFIPSVGDAWAWITERITDPDIRPATVEAARLLGTRTAEMHIAFASGQAANFVPEVASESYAERVRAEALAELRDTIDQLERRGVGNTATLSAALEGALDALLHLAGTMITRIHGDYHLGQVLRTSDDDFAILDFEGEPSRSLAERRAKASPLRDVAGMLRSFDYAAETARRAGGDTAGIDDWHAAARAAFLEGYDGSARESSVLMRGWDAAPREAALAAFELHKALYEVRYELNNRPDWLEIPLNALRRIAGAPA